MIDRTVVRAHHQAAGAGLPASVPFDRRVRAWERVARDLPMEKLEAMVRVAGLGDLPALGAAILKGGVQGRVVVDVNL